ncbi:tRNA 2-thiouridine(34) synthase MnmA [Aeoliella sp. ICT_H6.2]|uniref:tRNA-specific 2-thiouridylase MnmA n=1 Tax=Aeoliella straminimaris TaxID=2954799 RepID=A0A9X2F685_9BACT|nr:tRNA 2-thiouridine(34) synthase MnmA [Aeoliella straminimaris]MCO6042980.1 tRNA 2-thiouridine(34) synthase MnmA [Aeoliella straminimaris]
MARVVLAMSGGVDSSVAAHLLTEAGHQVIGVFMRHGEQSPAVCATLSGSEGTEQARSGGQQLPVMRLDHKQGCCTAADAEDARRVADRLSIPFYAIDLNEEFGRIMDYFTAEYVRGRTPNPCVQCNNWLKFGKLFDYADSVGAEFVATGHYARLVRRGGEVALVRGIDDGKDQSYVLFGIERKYLERMMLPVGEFLKPDIRELAAKVGMNVAEKKDSQEICFVTSGRYDEFVKRRREGSSTPGEFVTTAGEVVGTHEGIEGFTVGQRKGLGVALGARKFVVRIEADTNRVVLGDRDELGRRELTAAECNWLTDVPVDHSVRGLAQIRYNASAAPAEFTRLADGRLSVMFDEPQFAVAPGQAVVCFERDRVLGGGWIE